jgi:hypothetical protein
MTAMATNDANVHRQGAGAPPTPKKWMLWTGRVLSALPVLMMVFSASMKLMHSPQFIEQWVGKFGYQESAATGIGLLELACVVVYAIPRTAVLGAVLLTGYLGGAVATHVRLGDPSFVAPVVLGIIAWAGLYLRDDRVRALLPMRQ